jgi:TrmH RNA methyltransferase
MLNKLTDELAVCGFNAVAARVEYHPETINRLFFREDRLKSFTGICRILAERKRPYKICDDEELERISKSSHHQGVVAMILAPEVKPLNREDLEEWARESRTGLVLHSVGNDHNLGAIARAAAFFDVPRIVLSESDPGVRLSTGAFRVAEGGLEHVTVNRVQNTARFIRDAAKSIVVIGAEARARQRVGDLAGIIREQADGLPALKKSRPGIAVVLGNEETGLPKEIREACSCLVRIPGTGLMESLNVAQAAALFLHAVFDL